MKLALSESYAYFFRKMIRLYSKTSPDSHVKQKMDTKKYMEWLERGINVFFIDNPTVSSEYIKQMMDVAQAQDLVTRTAMEGVIKLLQYLQDRSIKQIDLMNKHCVSRNTLKKYIEAINENGG